MFNETCKICRVSRKVASCERLSRYPCFAPHALLRIQHIDDGDHTPRLNEVGFRDNEGLLTLAYFTLFNFGVWRSSNNRFFRLSTLTSSTHRLSAAYPFKHQWYTQFQFHDASSSHPLFFACLFSRLFA